MRPLSAILLLGVLSCLFNIAKSHQGTSCSGNGFTVDSTNCNVYYQCTNGLYVKQSCPAGLNWNTRGHYCDWPANSPCEENEAPQPEESEEAPQPPPTTTTTTTTTRAPVTTTTTRAPVTTTRAPPTAALISQAEFQSAAQTKGGNPTSDYYHGFLASLSKAGISNRREAILFLAHATWETVGFIYTKEVYCQTHLAACLQAYPNNAGGLPGRVYYGRGMMQLTWDYNYKAASSYLYGDDRLLQNPDQVGEDPKVGWATAAYYWWANVHSRSETFGSTLKAINGALECEGGSHGQNRYLRFMHYKDILTRLGEAHPADEDGWCTAW